MNYLTLFNEHAGCYPIMEYMKYAQRSIAGGAAAEYFDYGQNECVFIVDVDGAAWGVMGDYKSEAKYGNLFSRIFPMFLQAKISPAKS